MQLAVHQNSSNKFLTGKKDKHVNLRLWKSSNELFEITLAALNKISEGKLDSEQWSKMTNHFHGVTDRMDEKSSKRKRNE